MISKQIKLHLTMKPQFLTIFVLSVLFQANAYSQFKVAPNPIPRSSRHEVASKEVYGVISNPRDGNSFKGPFFVNGIAGNIPADHHLWLVVCPRESVGGWPQYKEIIPDKNTGSWNGKAFIGGDDGKLLDIVLVCANREANAFFNDYIVNQERNHFPEVPMPSGAKSLAHITVVKAPDDIPANDSINKYYGFSKTGVFYIHKSLITQAKGDVPCLVAGVTNWSNNTRMISDGDYYIYEAKIDKPYEIKLEYCFYIGKGLYIPQILLENSSRYIRKGDYRLNGSKDGNNFYTEPQGYYPGE